MGQEINAQIFARIVRELKIKYVELQIGTVQHFTEI